MAKLRLNLVAEKVYKHKWNQGGRVSLFSQHFILNIQPSMDISAFLSRLRFTFTVMFHNIFPPLGIGISVFCPEGLLLKSAKEHYPRPTKFRPNMFSFIFTPSTANGSPFTGESKLHIPFNKNKE